MISNMPENPIPFFVADRPKSLELLKYSEVHKQPFPLGLMGNANSSENFRKKFKKFKGKNIVKIADSGIFTKDGGLSKNYDELFAKYEEMGTNYGIILDVLKNKKQTLASAKEAITEYQKKRRSFKLIGVAQGKTIKEYLSCYKHLKRMGYKHIAIGGLLVKRLNSARFVSVRNEKYVENVVSTIRKEYPKDWIFLLGCFRPKRFMMLKKYNVFGADFKGWILNYRNPGEKRARALRSLHHIEKKFGIESKRLQKIITSNDREVFKIDSKEEKQRLQKIIKIRKGIAKKIRNEEYSQNIKDLQELMNIDPDKVRKFRFEQVRRFIHKQVFGPMHPKKLLIVSCSDRKKYLLSPTPAIDLYDGPMFRMIRNFDGIHYNGVDLMILSAKYGLMTHNHPIRNYDKRLGTRDLPRLQPQTKKRLQAKLDTANYKEIMLSMGKDYMQVFDKIDRLVPKECKIVKCEGRIGEKLHKTKKWLEKS